MSNTDCMTENINLLKPLFTEHKEGVLFAERTREGLKNHISPEKLAAYTRWFWKNHIRPHFFQEEKILLPLIESSNPLTIKLKHDHHEILDLMISIDRDVDSFSLSTLADFIERHIRWEENVFFPFLIANHSQEELDKVGSQLSAHAIVDSEPWKEAFWKI